MDVDVDVAAPLRPRGRLPERARLVLLDGFELYNGDRVMPMPMSVQRLLVFLALCERPVLRSQVAGILWLDTTEERATASLRSALWRLRRPGHVLVDVSATHLRLAAGVAVDYRDAVRHARALLDGTAGTRLLEDNASCLTCELLPGWWDDWLVVERERFRQLRLHALEARGSRLAELGRFSQAVEAGLAAVECEPLRESAHRLLISIHLAEGNRAEALRQYHAYRCLLHDELGLPPSPQIHALVRELLPARQVLSRAAAGGA